MSNFNPYQSPQAAGDQAAPSAKAVVWRRLGWVRYAVVMGGRVGATVCVAMMFVAGMVVALAEPQALISIVAILSYAGFIVGALGGIVSGLLLALATMSWGVPRRPLGEFMFAMVFSIVQVVAWLLGCAVAGPTAESMRAAIVIPAVAGIVSGIWLSIRMRRFGLNSPPHRQSL